MIDAVIFDMDGLLLDTERPAVDAWLQAAGELKLDLPEPVVLSTVGINWEGTKRIITEALGEDAPLERLWELTNSLYRGRLALGVPTKPGAEALLKMLCERGVSTGLATSTARHTAEWKLASAGLRQYIAGSACGDEVQKGKPHPDVFLLAAQRLGVDPQRCAALEDSPAGILAASAAGMTTILVPDLVEPPEEVRRSADHVAENLAEAGAILLKLLNPCYRSGQASPPL